MDATGPQDADRRAAVEDLKHLVSGGHLSAQEFADRSRAVEAATSLAELAAAVSPPSTASYGSAPAPATAAGGPVQPRHVLDALGRPFAGLGLRRLVGLVVTLVVGASFAFVGLLTDLLPDTGSPSSQPPGSQSPGSQPSAAPAPPRLHTTGGLARFQDAVRAEFGSSRYLTAVVYPDYASIELPVSGDALESRRAYYNGTFAPSATTTPRRAGARSADLRDVDVATLVKALRRAPDVLGVPDPTTSYLVFDQRDGRPAMSVYVGGTAGTGYWTMRLDGMTVRTYTP